MYPPTGWYQALITVHWQLTLTSFAEMTVLAGYAGRGADSSRRPVSPALLLVEGAGVTTYRLRRVDGFSGAF